MTIYKTIFQSVSDTGGKSALGASSKHKLNKIFAYLAHLLHMEYKLNHCPSSTEDNHI